MTKRNRQNLQSWIDAVAYGAAHAEATGDAAEYRLNIARYMGLLDGMQFAGRDADRTEARQLWERSIRHERDRFIANPPR